MEVIVEFANRGNVGSWFQHMGGASSRVANDATAFSHRAALEIDLVGVVHHSAEDGIGLCSLQGFKQRTSPE